MKSERRSLNQCGFDHIVLPLLFLVMFGIIGSIYYVLTHAATASVVKSGELSSGLINSAGHAMCLDDYQNNPENGAAVNIYPCSTTDQAQKWSLYSDNTLRHNGKCLDVYQQGTTNGSRIDLYTCNGGNNQQWKVGTNPKVSLNNLVGTQSGSCLDVYGSYTANSSKTDLWGCNGTDAQVWGWNTGSTIVPGGATADVNCNLIGGYIGGGECIMQLGGWQHNIANASGVSAQFNPYSLGCGLNCGHALTQFQVGSNDEKNMMEFGWNTTQQYSTPHLGIGLWANGQPLNADANFVQVSSTIKMNQAVSSGSKGVFMIQYFGGQWELYYNGTEIGYYPESIWTSRGTSLTNLQYVGLFAEGLGPAYGVARYQLGNAKLGSVDGSAAVSNYQLQGTTSSPDLSNLGWGKAPYYNVAKFNATGFNYGGPGLY